MRVYLLKQHTWYHFLNFAVIPLDMVKIQKKRKRAFRKMNKSTLSSYPFDKSDEGYEEIAQLMRTKFGASIPEKYLIGALKAQDKGFHVDDDIIGPLKELVENHYRGTF